MIFYFMGLALLWQGCNDDDTKPEVKTSNSTTPTPTNSISVTSTPRACVKTTPEGFWTIETQHTSRGYFISKMTCDFYPTFTESIQSPVFSLNENSLNELHGMFHDDQVYMKLGDESLEHFEVLQNLTEMKAETPFYSNLVSSVPALKQNEFIVGHAQEILGLSPDEFFALGDDEMVLKFFENGTQDAFEFLVGMALSGSLIGNVVFRDCGLLLEFIEGTFLSHSYNIDEFCDAQRPELSGRCIMPKGISQIDLNYMENGWKAESITCNQGEHSRALTLLEEEILSKIPKGTFFGDSVLHYVSCTVLNLGAAEWLTQAAERVCWFLPLPCQYNRTNFNISLVWDEELVETIFEEKKMAEATGHKLSPTQAFNDVRDLGVNAYALAHASCAAYPTFVDDIKSYFEKTNEPTFFSCDEAMMRLSEIMGLNMEEFCDPTADSTAENEPTCNVGAEGDEISFQLRRTNNTWMAGSAMCNGVESDEALTALTQGLTTFFPAALARMNCSRLMDDEGFGSKLAEMASVECPQAIPAAPQGGATLLM